MKKYIMMIFIIIYATSAQADEEKWLGCRVVINQYENIPFTIYDENILKELNLKKDIYENKNKKTINTELYNNVEKSIIDLYKKIIAKRTNTENINIFDEQFKELENIPGEFNREKAIAYLNKRVDEKYGSGLILHIIISFKNSDFPILYEIYIKSGKNILTLKPIATDIDFCTKKGLQDSVTKSVENLFYKYIEQQERYYKSLK